MKEILKGERIIRSLQGTQKSTAGTPNTIIGGVKMEHSDGMKDFEQKPATALKSKTYYVVYLKEIILLLADLLGMPLPPPQMPPDNHDNTLAALPPNISALLVQQLLQQRQQQTRPPPPPPPPATTQTPQNPLAAAIGQLLQQRQIPPNPTTNAALDIGALIEQQRQKVVSAQLYQMINQLSMHLPHGLAQLAAVAHLQQQQQQSQLPTPPFGINAHLSAFASPTKQRPSAMPPPLSGGALDLSVKKDQHSPEVKTMLTPKKEEV